MQDVRTLCAHTISVFDRKQSHTIAIPVKQLVTSLLQSESTPLLPSLPDPIEFAPNPKSSDMQIHNI